MTRHLAVTTAILWCGAAHAQSFDVASIKPSPVERPAGFPFHLGPSSFSMQGRLYDLVQQAYDVKPYQIAGGPAWMQSEFYDVLAKAGTDADSQQIRLMLQTLLADRFQLKLHRETRMTAGYVLIVDKNGPKLPPPRTDLPPESKGVIQMGGGIWARGAPLSQIAYGLTLTLGQPVVDETKIAGHFDVRLRFEDGDDAGAIGSIFPALHEVGLKLEARKVPLEVLVIDSAEKATAN